MYCCPAPSCGSPRGSPTSRTTPGTTTAAADRILPGAGVKVIDGLWVGMSLNFLAGPDGARSPARLDPRARGRVDEKVPSVARINAGVLYQFIPSVRIGATFRQRFELPFATRADTEVAGEPIDLDLRAAGQFTPNQVTVGGAFLDAMGHVALDLTWSNWSEFPGPFVVVESELPLVGPLAGALPAVPYRDTIAARIGGEIAASEAVTLRGGYGFETRRSGGADRRDQPARRPQHTIGLGLGLGWKRATGKRVRLDLHVSPAGRRADDPQGGLRPTTAARPTTRHHPARRGLRRRRHARDAGRADLQPGYPASTRAARSSPAASPSRSSYEVGARAGRARAPATAAADPFDEFGFGARAAGTRRAHRHRGRPRGGAPQRRRRRARRSPGDDVGWGYGPMQLDIDGEDGELLDPHGTSLGLAIPIDVGGGWTIGGGLAMYLPDQFLARVQLIPSTEPHYVLLDNDPHRVVVEPVAAIAYGDRFAIGAGASVLADARSNEIVFDVGVVAGEKVGEAALDIEMPVRMAPIIGVWGRPHPRVRAGATFRGELSLDLVLDILANVEIAGVVTGDALVSLRAKNYYTPARATAGVAVDVTDALTLSGDLTWSRWSTSTPASPTCAPGAPTSRRRGLDRHRVAPFEDTLAPGSAPSGGTRRRPRAPLRAARRLGVTAVAGARQTGLTSFADGDRCWSRSRGVTLATGHRSDPADRPRPGFACQHVGHRLTARHRRVPGQAFSSGGEILHAGCRRP